MGEITVQGVCSSDHLVWAKILDKHTIEIRITDEAEEIEHVIKTHIFAWESLVYFAKQVLSEDVHIQEDISRNEYRT